VVGTEDLGVPLARHQYSLGVVAGSLALVLQAGTPLRRVAAVLAMSWSWAGVDAAVASSYSVRLWLLRLGLDRLNRAKEQAGDWMWIVDHTLQIGDRKCLIVVGIRQSVFRPVAKPRPSPRGRGPDRLRAGHRIEREGGGPAVAHPPRRRRALPGRLSVITGRICTGASTCFAASIRARPGCMTSSTRRPVC
jgi:hypothetical protein